MGSGLTNRIRGKANPRRGMPRHSIWGRPSVVLVLMAAPWIPRASLADPLAEGFRDPPHEFSIVPLWSWNSRLEPDVLRWQIDQMVDQGVYGAFMHARSGIDGGSTPYFSPGWWTAVKATVEYGSQVGFAAWIYDEDKWPSGAAGGRTLAKNPSRNQAKVLRCTETRVTGPRRTTISIPNARYVIAGRLVGERRIDPDSLVDIAQWNVDAPGKAAAQAAPWACPDGNWIVFGYVYEPFHGVNYLNRQTVRDFIDITHEEYARRFGPQFGHTIPGVFFDEIQNEAGKRNGYIVWAEGFAERFRNAKGYDLARFLPALTADIGPRTPAIRCDYYDVYTTLYEEAWFEQIADWCRDHGLALVGHTIEELNRYVSQGSYMRTQRHLQIPTTDNEDFRYRWPRLIDPWKPKQVASVSHLYGQARTGVEAMGGAGWSFTLESARYGFNMLAAYGVNFFVPHLFHYAQDKPVNVNDWPNSWFFRNPFWKYFKTLADHGRRLSFMLTGGTHVVDVAVLYPEANLWAGLGPGTVQETIERLVAAPIDADVIDPDSLLRAATAGGVLAVGDMRYRVLVVPGVRCVRRAEADRILAFAQAGGVVIVHDCWPTASMDEGRADPHLQRFRRAISSLGVELSEADNVVRAVAGGIRPDVVVTDTSGTPLRYHHVRRDDRDLYWVVNSDREAGMWRVSFRAVGAPAVWQPEDGSIRPVTTFVRSGDRTELPVALDGRQGCFVVFSPSPTVPEGGLRVTATNLLQATALSATHSTASISGLLPTGASRAEARVTFLSGNKERRAQGGQDAAPAPEPVRLDGPWRFLAVGDRLDHAWRTDVEEVDLSLPVMRVRWERTTGEPSDAWYSPHYDDRRWRRVKIRDAMHPAAGAARYRSRWEGRFITYYHYTPFDIDRFFEPKIGGKGLRCRKTLLLPPEATHGWLAVVCPGPFRVYLNDRLCGAGPGGTQPDVVALPGLRPGESTLTVAAADAPAILAEGQILTNHGPPITIFTDSTWEATRKGDREQAAWEYVAPPERPYGEPEHPREPALPRVVWYRQPLPPGAVTVRQPHVDGRWNAWIDGTPLTFADGQAEFLPSARLLVLRVETQEGQRALLDPVIVRCRPTEQPLGSWTDCHLAWYSGRAIYSKRFPLDARYTRDDLVLKLDLGKVCYAAECWLNGKRIGTRIWPPYRVDITGFVKPGMNQLDVVVANLIANRMAWDITDDAKASLMSRRWHDSNLRRDAWCFESGLLGPARIIAFRRVTVVLGAE